MGKTILFGIGVCIFMQACSMTRKTGGDRIFVKGEIDTLPGAVYYISSYGNPQIADTIKLDKKRRFVFQTKSVEPLSIRISIPNTGDKRVLGDIPYYDFWADPGETAKIFGGKKRGDAKVTGSSTQKIVDSIALASKSLIEKQKEVLRRSLKDDILRFNHADQKTYDSLETAVKEIEQNYIETHPGSFYSAYLLSTNYRFDPQAYALVNKLYQSLSPDVRSTPTGKRIKASLDVQSQWQTGQILPDFSQTDTAGSPVKLSSLRGKVVLVDFWASWCGPCRAENPNVVKAYQQYHPKGFEILGVSLDDKKPDWLKAIQDDKLIWMHVSDLKGWKNAVAEQYQIHSIPDNFLLDKNGRIIGRGLRGEELEKKLAELM